MGKKTMALSVQMTKGTNALINEGIITPRLVNQQTLQFSEFCDYMSQGSTVTAADVAAVMKQLEKSLPTILGLNTKVIVSPDGLTIRPAVKGSLTQSQLKAKLTAKRDAYLAAGDTKSAEKVDVNREIETSDLTTSDLTASIVIDLPKKWDQNFQQTVVFKRVNRVVSVAVDEPSDENEDGNANGNGDANGNGNENSGTQGSGSQTSGNQTSGNQPGDSGDDDDFTPPEIGG